MEQLIKFIIQNHPEFAEEIKGVTDEEIQKLENLTLFPPIPDQYRTFLKYMGGNMGRIKCILKEKSHLSVDKFEISNYEILIDYNSVYRSYKDQQIANKRNKHKKNTFSHVVEDIGEKAENFFFIGNIPKDCDSIGLFLDLRKKDYPIVEIWDDGQIFEKSPSFIEFIFSDYFKREVSTYQHNRKWMT